MKARAIVYMRMWSKKKVLLEPIQELLYQVCATKFNLYDFGGNYIDETHMATVPFAQRPQGNKLLVDVSRGDLIVCKNFSLAFSELYDMHNTLKRFHLRGVSCYFHDLGLMCSEEEPGAYEFLSDLVSFDREMKNWKCPHSVSNDIIWEIAHPMRERGMSHAQIAAALNSQKTKTTNGRTWREGSVRAWYSRMCRAKGV